MLWSDLYRFLGTIKCMPTNCQNNAALLTTRNRITSGESMLSTSNDIIVVVGDARLRGCCVKMKRNGVSGV